ncbi:MAG: signal peptidase I [Holosporaceae bacterium]|jgi:signal peptidase I|nr:signal peptidase I [Holosporaceae bacterium]
MNKENQKNPSENLPGKKSVQQKQGEEKNTEGAEKKPVDGGFTKSKWTVFKEEIKFILVFVFFFSLFRFFVFDWYIVPSSSMVPTLLVGDMPFVEKFRYGFSKHSIWFSPNLFSGRFMFKDNVKRGEVIVFKHPQDEMNPENNDINLIKRVIALPGDTIRMDNGVIFVNNRRASLTYKEKIVYHDTNTGEYMELYLFEEKLPLSDAPSHTVAYRDKECSSRASNFAEIVVPKGRYFVMGDNRDYSKDSRVGLGVIPAENLMGRAWFLVYSIANGVRLWEFWRWLQNIRYSRLLQRII